MKKVSIKARGVTGPIDATRASGSIKDVQKQRKRKDYVLFQKDGKLELVSGMKATSIIAGHEVNDSIFYRGRKLIWPEKRGRSIVEITIMSDQNGNLFYRKGKNARHFAKHPLKGCTVEFSHLKKKRN
ncbi:MAG TPA: hypothetical protein VJ892_03395 [Candidatus Absconditabacterales bacterium]|nr:hypothetical protein [Candidatus Absconditabacterales bacterium]